MRRIITSGLLALTLAACGDAGTTTAERPGNPAVYERIAAETDCAELQAQFDTAAAGPRSDWKVPYMDAADARMREVGCYD